MAPSVDDGTLGSTCSEGAMQAIFGVSMPSSLAVWMRYPISFCFCLKSGAGITATSEMQSSLGSDGISRMATWLSTPLGGKRPASLFRMPRMYLSVETSPFIRTSASPATTAATASRTQLTSLFSSTILKIEQSIPSAPQTSSMTCLSP